MDGAPDHEALSPAPRSLAARLRFPALGAADWRVAAAFGLLIAAGPLLTLAGAQSLAARVERQTAKTREALAPRIAAERAYIESRRAMADAAGRPGPGTVLDSVARALPADASLSRAERMGDGALELDIATPDPDSLRAALRRAPELARLRDAGQRRGDAGMIVSMRAEAE